MDFSGTDGKTYRPRILFADDVELNRDLVQGILSSANFEVDTVVGGREAVEALNKAPYDLVLMDIDMPDFDGYEAAAAIRRTAPISRVSVVALTCKASDADRARAEAAGMTDHIARPISPSALVTKVTQILSNTIPPKLDDDSVWCQRTFTSLETLLGRDRMNQCLALLIKRFAGLQCLLRDPADRRDDIAQSAHDMISAAGMLGFVDVSQTCHAAIESIRAHSGDTAFPRLADALRRATDLLALKRPLLAET